VDLRCEIWDVRCGKDGGAFRFQVLCFSSLTPET
jgi:hypothetical protein